MKEERGRGAAGWAGMIIALVIGVGIGYAITSNNNSPGISENNSKVAVSTTTKSADLRANFVGLGTEHIDLTSRLIAATLDGSPSIDAIKADLIKNGEQISGAIGDVYGQATQAELQNIWNVPFNELTNYANSSKNSDQAGKDTALASLNEKYTKPLAKLLADVNPNLSQKSLEADFGKYVDMVAQMIDSHTNGNYEQEAKLRGESVKHMNRLMSKLAEAIVKQYPSKFQG